MDDRSSLARTAKIPNLVYFKQKKKIERKVRIVRKRQLAVHSARKPDPGPAARRETRLAAREEAKVKKNTPKPASEDILTPMVREVKPLDPILNAPPNGEDARKRKLLRALAENDRMLQRQDRIWQNELRQREWLLRPKNKKKKNAAESESEEKSDSIRIWTYNKLP